MKRNLSAFVLVALASLLLVACDTGVDDDYAVLETEVVTLREDFDAFNEQWGTFYEDWAVYREEVGVID